MIQPGFYYQKDERFERCLYLTGEKKGNKWIDIRSVGISIPDADWYALAWMCVNGVLDDLGEYTFHETNPTQFELKLKK